MLENKNIKTSKDTTFGQFLLAGFHVGRERDWGQGDDGTEECTRVMHMQSGFSQYFIAADALEALRSNAVSFS